MNFAPISKEEIYNWLRQNIIANLASSLPETDFDELDNLINLYSVEVNKFKRGVGKLYGQSTDIYKQKLAERLEELRDNLHATTMAYCRFCGGERGKLVVIVLDNCDKG